MSENIKSFAPLPFHLYFKRSIINIGFGLLDVSKYHVFVGGRVQGSTAGQSLAPTHRSLAPPLSPPGDFFVVLTNLF